MIVKICGITNVRDARAAQQAGADMLGLVFTESSRKVSIRTARDISEDLGNSVLKVGVFVDEDLPVVIKTAQSVGLDLVQLHGRESLEYCRMLEEEAPFKIIKAFRVGGGDTIKSVASYRDSVDYVLVDSFHPYKAGGTGQIFDWSLTDGLDKFNIPWILAGGLRPSNVAAAIAQCRPDGVDVSGGVESNPGIKDHTLITDFIKHARGGSGD